MEDQVEQVKRKSDIVTVVGQYVQLKKAGRHHKGLCPFHAEKTPSFLVNEDLGLYKCFGCGAGGDVFKFLMEIEGIDFVEALRGLADKAGVELAFKKDEFKDEKKELLDVLDLASRYYHYLLTEHKEGQAARDYLKERKISDKLIKSFNLGFAIPSWDGLIKYLVNKKGYKIETLEKAGLVTRKNSGSGFYDKFRGRVMFPLQDPAGKVIGFSGRILPSLAKDEDAKYMNSPETELYHKGKSLYGFYQAKQAIREKKQVVLVEGMLDLISSFGAGVGETVGVGGTALTSDQIEMLARLSTKIIFAMDADEAGTTAIKRSIDIAEKRGMNIKVVHIVGGKDPDEIARKSPKLWREMIEKPVSVYEFFLNKSLEKYPKENDDRIKEIANEMVPLLAKIEQNMERDRWAKKLADALGVDKESVVREINKAISGLKVSFEKEKGKLTNSMKGNERFRKLIGLVFVANSQQIKEIKKWLIGETLEGAEGKLLLWLFENKGEKEIKDIIGSIPAELKPTAEEILLEGDFDNPPSDKDLKLQVSTILRRFFKEKKDALLMKMEEARIKGDSEEEERLSNEDARLNKKFNEVTAILA